MPAYCRGLRSSVLVAAFISLGCFAARAQDAYPTKPVTLILPVDTGGSIDSAARIIQPALEKQLGRPIVLVDRGGGGGIIGTEFVMNAKPDGYTLIFQSVSSGVVNAITKKDLVKTDLRKAVPITEIATSPRMVVISSAIGVNTVKEFVDLVKPNPGKYNFGQDGDAAVLGAALFMRRTGIQMTNVAYKSAVALRLALVTNDIQMRVGNPSPDLPFIQSGQIKPLCVASLKRTPLIPDAPTCAESGVPNFVQSSWVGILGPPGTPDNVVKRIYEATQAALKDPEVIKAYAAQGNEIVGSSPSEFRTFLDNEFLSWKEAGEAAAGL